MQEMIFHADSYELLFAEAKRLGFTKTDNDKSEHIAVNGEISGATYFFFNYVGTVHDNGNVKNNLVDMLGVWARARLNGQLIPVPEFSSSVRRYVFSFTLNKWVNSVTNEIAPDCLSEIGVIA